MVSRMPTGAAASTTRPAGPRRADPVRRLRAHGRRARRRRRAAHAGRRGSRSPGASTPSAWRDEAAGLAALGVGRGDTVAIMLTNRPEFHVVDCAAMHLGAVPFSVYNTSSPEQLEYLLGDAGNRVVICERAFLDRVLAARGGAVPPSST